MGTGAVVARPRPRLPGIVRLARGLAMPVGSVLFAFVAGGVIVFVTGANPLGAYQGLLCGGAGLACAQGENSALQISNSLVYAIPLVMCGVAVALPFRAGLFNIGAEGQLLAGTITATAIGVHFAAWPAVILLPVVLVGGAVAGALWAGIAGVLKATTGAHEVVTTIMLNYAAQWLLRFLIIGGPLQPPGEFSASAPIGGNARLPTFLPNDSSVIVFGLPATVYRVH
ncbi:MAG TPA: hypothetical protein VKT20_04740, partial [Candidatus Dormibacteraeota bacterium]|nr:hypothetical protein [Candidatus Dormibacteraeota bacterium]